MKTLESIRKSQNCPVVALFIYFKLFQNKTFPPFQFIYIYLHALLYQNKYVALFSSLVLILTCNYAKAIALENVIQNMKRRKTDAVKPFYQNGLFFYGFE